MNEFLLRNLSSPVTTSPEFKTLIKSKFGVNLSEGDDIKIIKRAIDARNRNHLKFVYTVSLITSKKLKPHNDIVIQQKPETRIRGIASKTLTPFIIGMGPAGLFAALELVQYGIKPYLFDKGDDIDTRKLKVENFWKNKQLDPNSNVQFGEGGAGAFSDGKLTARTHNSETNDVFDWLIKFGADPDIAINALPHLGTDKLVEIIKNIKKYLIEKGCKFFYNQTLTDLKIENNKVQQITVNNQTYSPENLILAVGNSSRDIFTLCVKKNIPIESKPFAVGLRIEHDIDYINSTFYGEKNDFTITGPASYKLISKSAYSFCMCPGGFIIPANSEIDGQVVNGMSFSKRDNNYSNSAIVVSVNNGEGIPLKGMNLQHYLEKLYFKNFIAPSQNVKDFMNNELSKKLFNNSYCHGVIAENFASTLPKPVSDALKNALIDFDKKYDGFINNGLFIGIETRTSSPVRIIRQINNFHSLNVTNLYPAGEGSGYAGGIISSATDGLRVARAIAAG